MRLVSTVTAPCCRNRFWTDNESLASSVALLALGRTWTASLEGWYEHFSTWHNLAAFSADSALGSGIDKAQSDLFSLVSVGGVTQTQSAPTPVYVLSQVSSSSDLSSLWTLLIPFARFQPTPKKHVSDAHHQNPRRRFDIKYHNFITKIILFISQFLPCLEHITIQ